MKQLEWLGGSKKDLIEFPEGARQEIGYALYVAQTGGHYHKTKPFKGCGSSVYEVAIEYEKNAYRAIYSVFLDDAIYVIHCFQKKSKRGIKTPKEDIELVKQRLKLLKELTNR